MYRFLIVIENAGKNFSAYSPDLPGCVATGSTREETERRMFEAIQMHVEGLLGRDEALFRRFRRARSRRGCGIRPVAIGFRVGAR